MNLKDRIGEIKFNKSFFTTFTRKKIIILVAIILCITLLGFFLFGRGKKANVTDITYTETQAKIGNITETIEQSGVVEPLDRYEITSLVKGEILFSPFEEGDSVKEGDTLYQIDDEDAQLNMEKAQMNLEEANENVNNLNIFAPASGKLTNFSLQTGDKVNSGVIGNIKNTEKLSIDVPFSVSDFEKISIGDKVTATSALYMTSLSGTVTHKYTAPANDNGDGSVVRNIEIEIENPGALSDGTTFAATVHTRIGSVNSAGSGVIDGGTTTALRAEVSGEVMYVGVKDGDYVKKGQLIAQLKNNSLVNSQKSSQLSVKSNYNITSPISGTVITKNSKAGDKIDSSNSQTVMMVVADMSKMKFTISVDELDIADIHLGQTAIVDADALPEETFEAKVTNIASEGVSSGDGVTTFDIELTIDEPGRLKSGMNVNANILINEAYNVVTIPEDALMGVNGSTATVLVKTDGKATKNADDDAKKKNSQKPYSAEKGEFPGRPEGAQNDDSLPAPPGGTMNGEMPQMPENTGKTASSKKSSNIPDGCEIRSVTIGVSDGINVEIVSGLEAGETIVYIPSSAGSSNPFARMMGAMHGGMMGGGMPTGGMPGGGNRTGSGMSRSR